MQYSGFGCACKGPLRQMFQLCNNRDDKGQKNRHTKMEKERFFMRHEIYLAGGCFWGLEMFLSLLPGVHGTECCYVNGHTDAPSYADVCRGGTGYAEAVRVIFDDGALPLPKLLEMFYSVIDPRPSTGRAETQAASTAPAYSISATRTGR